MAQLKRVDYIDGHTERYVRWKISKEISSHIEFILPRADTPTDTPLLMPHEMAFGLALAMLACGDNSDLSATSAEIDIRYQSNSGHKYKTSFILQMYPYPHLRTDLDSSAFLDLDFQNFWEAKEMHGALHIVRPGKELGDEETPWAIGSRLRTLDSEKR